eukprot:TRINITY_DN74446_c0_g1_i1.p1 TRINITY_DN74446_c0_g1~~TRINITY_DN74446_c0_g1_i1.p1  ORF type:complete len:496 (-),score=77.54 TRINITY_DN74446_c0_g1_i1:248-1735(-)
MGFFKKLLGGSSKSSSKPASAAAASAPAVPVRSDDSARSVTSAGYASTPAVPARVVSTPAVDGVLLSPPVDSSTQEERDIALAMKRSLADERRGKQRSGAGASAPAAFAAVPASPSAGGRPCSNGCGWTAFGEHATCCRACSTPAGPHAKDCEVKNRRLRPACSSGCGRPAFAAFSTCCTKCTSAAGPHALDCEIKCRGDACYASGVTPAAEAKAATSPSKAPLPQSPAEMEEGLRTHLAELQATGTTQTPADQRHEIQAMATSARMSPDAVRMLWLSVARSARATGGSASIYVALAEKHHGVRVEIIDLGQYSAERSNSCMFLSCAASIYDLRMRGHEDCWGLGNLKETLEGACGWHQGRSTDELVAEHRQNRSGALGRMADALRHAACEVLSFDEEFYLPFFNPLAGRTSAPPMGDASQVDAFRAWVSAMRGEEEGDELVILALARLCALAVQPVQRSGYHVPLMDPCESAESGATVYWGNDDMHWVWLRPKM